MTSTETHCGAVKHSIRPTTPTARKAVIFEKFLIEKELKNEAYAFILSKHLLNEFRDFCHDQQGRDKHDIALVELLAQMLTHIQQTL